MNDLEHIKDAVLRFISAILDGMKVYYDKRLYLREPNKVKGRKVQVGGVP